MQPEIQTAASALAYVLALTALLIGMPDLDGLRSSKRWMLLAGLSALAAVLGQVGSFGRWQESTSWAVGAWSLLFFLSYWVLDQVFEKVMGRSPRTTNSQEMQAVDSVFGMTAWLLPVALMATAVIVVQG